jgi:RHH-type proline utilization regulon transcriptional repressor/proline dehydrogenase/delta 1-pyrroline-5-carboxylate dehydrogenase
VKGAYWDTEIKLAQIGGYEGFPLFTRKVSTDVSYLACARYLLDNRDVFYPQFATHNAHTVAAVSVMAGNDREFEFQRLHGMGQALYDAVTRQDGLAQPCRIYAPVGSHEDLLAYLVRRLLENGANTSFVNRLADDESPIEEIVEDPVAVVRRLDNLPHPRIAQPSPYLQAPQEFCRRAAVGRCNARTADEADRGCAETAG